jgi:hypothetical protein
VKKEITTELVRELLNYDKDTGLFTWRSRDRDWFKSQRSFNIWNNRFAGVMAGNVRKDVTGYPALRISVLGKSWQAHRLAFLWMDEALPKQVDHLNRDSLDNRWNNLAASSAKENMKNLSMMRNNTSGVTGVSWDKSTGKWKAVVSVDGKRKHLGYFIALGEATQVVKTFKAAYGYSDGHGEQLAKYLEKSVDSAIQNS